MKLIRLDSTDSTNVQAFRYLNHFDPVIVTACTQSAGRGRGENRWESPRGNIYLSVGKTTEARTLAGLSVRIAIQILSRLNPLVKGKQLQIKWPNDLYLHDKKAGGILVESKITAEKARVVVGIGLNLATAPTENAAAVIFRKLPSPREEIEQLLIKSVLNAFSRADAPGLNKQLAALSWFQPGDEIRFNEKGKMISGIFAGFAENLEMQVKTGTEIRTITTSAVSKIRKKNS